MFHTLGTWLSATAVATLFCQSALAQQQQQATQKTTVSSLAAQGVEVKAAYPGGAVTLLVLQKGKDVFLCAVAWRLPSDCYLIQ